MPILDASHKGPIVYIFKLRGRAMYVGSTNARRQCLTTSLIREPAS